jgi:hypothetical protein
VVTIELLSDHAADGESDDRGRPTPT